MVEYSGNIKYKMKHFIQKRSTIALAVILLLTGSANLASGIGQATATPNHFRTVWAGENGQDHMNFLVISAFLDQQSPGADDEIAVFSGSKCVGATRLTTTIDPTKYNTFVSLVASRDDGGNNGFTDNDTVVFKIWKNVTQQEVVISSAVYRSDKATWLTTGKFVAGATSVVELGYTSGINQTVSFIKGNNLFSTYLIPFQADISAVFKSLTDSGLLGSVTDESGKSYTYSTKTKIWTNNIGLINKTEGYLVSVLNNCQLTVNGKMIDLPLSIPLKAGWNIISYPKSVVTDAMQVVQPLIDQGKLIKVQDEQGNSIEIAKRTKVWINSIGNFVPGKAYKINVSSDVVLTIQ